ncbi:MAG TPA: MaoC/PaaZ C-terminal domain-containing protein [Solirubrobacteraceae bacterium]|jgi:3-hydroxybutyryl-CoA dehydratase|nr:MaoC/PaaZ C-terminal domain-containing protein [Solirubrobacteraceae bacterium]
MTPAITDTISWWAPFEALDVGQEFVTRGRTVTEADVVGFAQLTGDWHPQHADAQWAQGSPFGERIAHGMLVVSLAAGLVPFDPGRVVALRQVSQATFKRPVRFGDTVHVEGRIAELGPASDDAGIVTFAWNVVNQDEKIVCRARVDVLWRRDGAVDPDDLLNDNPEAPGVENDGRGFVPIPL